MVMAIKIEEYKLSKTFFLTSNNIPITKFKPDFIRSLGLPNSIYTRGINKNIIPKNIYIKLK